MSLRALPLQFLNLGGEMMYIIDQRLRAQSISVDRADKVRNDILSIMLSKQFIEELFHLQPLYSKVALRTVFNKLAHASIMKLNAPSMDKLFDLMLMSLKHQVVLAAQPRDLLLITLNHLDTMGLFATNPEVFDQVQQTRTTFLKVYSTFHPSEWINIRRDLLMFVQDLHIRVSIFLKSGIQDHFGNLIIPIDGPVASGCEVPGTVRFFDASGEISLVTLFPNGGSYACAVNASEIEYTHVCAERSTKLGLNIYSDEEKDSYQIVSPSDQEDIAYQNFAEEDREALVAETSELKGRQELNLLAQLIGTVSKPSENKEFRLNLFLGGDKEGSDNDVMGNVQCGDVITIDGKLRERHPELGKILGELDAEDELPTQSHTCQDDLLDLLDST